MLYFEKVRFKNFMSFGNSWSEFDFPKGIIRVLGKNGEGKCLRLSSTNIDIKFDNIEDETAFIQFLENK